MLEKPAYNEEFRVFDFSPQLAVGETVSSASVIITDHTGADVSTSMVSDVAVYLNTSIIYKLKGGTAGSVYTRHFQVETTSGNKLEDSAKIKVV